MIKDKKSMTPVVAILIFITFLLIIMLIVISMIISYAGTKELSCDNLILSNITAEQELIRLEFQNSNIAEVNKINFYVNDLCKYEYRQKIESGDTREIDIITERQCVPAKTLTANIELDYRLSEKSCELKNEIGS